MSYGVYLKYKKVERKIMFISYALSISSLKKCEVTLGDEDIHENFIEPELTMTEKSFDISKMRQLIYWKTLLA